MNNLEKVQALLANGSRTIVYGYPSGVTADPVISLSITDSDNAAYAMGDVLKSTYTTVDISVYATDYLTGYNLLLAIKSEIQTVVKSTVKIVFANFGELKYDSGLQRQVLTSKYKIIE